MNLAKKNQTAGLNGAMVFLSILIKNYMMLEFIAELKSMQTSHQNNFLNEREISQAKALQ
jgi:hypothetical protein